MSLFGACIFIHIIDLKIIITIQIKIIFLDKRAKKSKIEFFLLLLLENYIEFRGSLIKR